jgi:hypothetical protein
LFCITDTLVGRCGGRQLIVNSAAQSRLLYDDLFIVRHVFSTE